MESQSMSDKKIIEYKKEYKKKGTVMIPFEENVNPLTEKDFKILYEYCEKVEKEFIEIGDAGESNNLMVGRFMTDKLKPEIVKNPYSNKVIEILSGNKIISFIKKILDLNNEIIYRRIQYNQINNGNFVGYHLDTDSNPDYIAACVLQIGDNYTGGKYRVYQKDGSHFDYRSGFGDLIISNCTYPHEVTKVESGNRKSLVFFISEHAGENKRNN